MALRAAEAPPAGAAAAAGPATTQHWMKRRVRAACTCRHISVDSLANTKAALSHAALHHPSTSLMNNLDSGSDFEHTVWHCAQVQRRLAQNREAARKSRQRKKDYMKQLEVEVCPALSCSNCQVR